MKLFDLIDYVLQKTSEKELNELKSKYGWRKSLWNGIRWFFVILIFVVVFYVRSVGVSNETATLLAIVAVIIVILAWIAFYRGSKANIKHDILEVAVVLKGGARNNFKNLFIDKSDDALSKQAAELISEALLEVIDESNTVDKLKLYMKSNKYPIRAKTLLIKMFKELKKMVTIIVDDFNIQLPVEERVKTQEIGQEQKDAEGRLEELKKLYEGNLINEEEYKRRKEEILKEI